MLFFLIHFLSADVLLNLRYFKFHVVPELNQVIFNAGDECFFAYDFPLESAQKSPDPVVFFLVDSYDRFESMTLMGSEHLALATSRPLALQTVVVQVDSVLPTLLDSLVVLDQPHYDCRQFVEEP